MKRVLSLAVMLFMLAYLAPVASGADTPAGKITALPAGARIDVQLKNEQRLQGVKGAMSATGFLLVNPQTGDRSIAFTDVVSVRQLPLQSHVKRNVLIGAGAGVAAIGITAALILRCAPLGCGKHNGL